MIPWSKMTSSFCSSEGGARIDTLLRAEAGVPLTFEDVQLRWVPTFVRRIATVPGVLPKRGSDSFDFTGA